MLSKREMTKRTRWIALPMALFLQMIAGSAYSFGAYSNQLKGFLQIDQSMLNIISSVGSIGLYLIIPAGFFLDKFGPRATAILGGIIGSIGYFLAWIITIGGLPKNTALISICFFIAWQGAGWLDTAAVATTVKNFPHNSGLILGLVKSFFGLSGSIFGQLYLAFFSPLSSASDSGNLGSLLVILFGVANCVGRMLGGYSADYFRDKLSRPIFYAFAFLLMSIAQLLYILSPNRSEGSCPTITSRDASGVPFFLFLGISIIVLSLIAGSQLRLSPALTEISRAEKVVVQHGYVIVLVLSIFLAIIGMVQDKWKSDGLLEKHHTETTWFTIAMLIIIIMLLCVAIGGCRSDESVIPEGNEGLLTMNSLQSNSRDNFQTMLNLTMFQTFCTFDFWLVWFAQLFGAGCGLMVINNLGQIAIAYGKSTQLLVATIMMGIAYGNLWSLNPTLLMELFGRDHYGAIYALGNLAPAIGSYAMSAGLAASIYTAQKKHEGLTCCLGTSCYGTTFLVGMFLCLFAAMLSFFLAFRTRKFYDDLRSYMCDI